MVHYFNSQCDGQTPEIFKANLLKYLLVAGIVDNFEEFCAAIKNSPEIKPSGFNLNIKNQRHEFRWNIPYITIPENCPDNSYIVSASQMEDILYLQNRI